VLDFGFYGREGHVSLIRENRLIAGLNTLQELAPKLRQNVLLTKDKVASGATVEDAETLARYERLVPGRSRLVIFSLRLWHRGWNGRGIGCLKRRGGLSPRM
jgi:hypothetical protein